MYQFEQCTQHNNRGTPAICIVQKGLSGHAIHPLLQPIDDIMFTVSRHLFLLLLLLVVFAKLRTQRKPI